MGLVEYSASEEEEEEERPASPPAKKKVSTDVTTELPPLPASFLDQYSSTVRTSTQDDPSMHGGRKRVTAHVQGNWPTHVYLEWHPNPTESALLSQLLCSIKETGARQQPEDDRANSQTRTVNSLLESDLGATLPLHISFSRPLVLKTVQRDAFLLRLRQTITTSNIKAFEIHFQDLAWHANETGTRWFLVLRLPKSPALSQLLDTCNAVAGEFQQPLLYHEFRSENSHGYEGRFHISIAWSLQAPKPETLNSGVGSRILSLDGVSGLPYEIMGKLSSHSVNISEVKVRIGQDVQSIALKAGRRVSQV